MDFPEWIYVWQYLNASVILLLPTRDISPLKLSYSNKLLEY